MRKLIVLLIGITICWCNGSAAFADRSAMVEKMASGLSSESQDTRITTAKLITRAGLQDDMLYRQIAEMLLSRQATATTDDDVDEMAWLCKALAASGDPQYEKTLDDIAHNSSNSKIKHYARQSSGLIGEYARQNAILNDTSNWDPALSDEDNRLLALLHSGEMKLIRDAAKTIYRRPANDEKMYLGVSRVLETMSKNYGDSDDAIDTMAWLGKVLGKSGNGTYLTILKRVKIAKSGNLKLKSHLNKAIEALE